MGQVLHSPDELHQLFSKIFGLLRADEVHTLDQVQREQYEWFRAMDRSFHFSSGNASDSCPLNNVFAFEGGMVDNPYLTLLSENPEDNSSMEDLVFGLQFSISASGEAQEIKRKKKCP
jgi:hypothetical protein